MPARALVLLTVVAVIGYAGCSSSGSGSSVSEHRSTTPVVPPAQTVSPLDYATRVAVSRAQRGLIDATPEGIQEAALELTRARYDVLSGTPQVVLARPARPGDLGTPEVSCPASPEDGPVPWLVILHGDFDVRRGMIGGGHITERFPPAHYIAYVYDLRLGLPSTTQISVDGSSMRKELAEQSGAPTSTAIPTATPQPTPAPGPDGVTHIPYGCGVRAAERAYMERVWGPAPPTFTAVPRATGGAAAASTR